MKGKKGRRLESEIDQTGEYSPSKGGISNYDLERLDREVTEFTRKIIGTMIEDRAYRRGRRRR
jgi:hypothetical protein